MIASGAVTFHLGDASWHDGPGWYYTIDDYPDEGSCGAFATRDEAAAHALESGYEAAHAPKVQTMSATVVYAYDAFKVLANPVSKEVSLRVSHRSPVREMTPDQARTLARVLVEAAELAEGLASVSK